MILVLLSGCDSATTSEDSAEGSSRLPTASIPAPDAAPAALTAADRTAWIKRFRTAMSLQNRRELNRLVDWKALEASVLRDLPLTEANQVRWRQQVLQPLREQGFTEELCLSAGRGDLYDFLGKQTSTEEAIASLTSEDGQSLDFHGWVLGRDTTGTVRAVDLFSYSTGEFLSRSLRRSALGFLHRTQPGQLDGLTERERAFIRNMPAIEELVAASEAGDVVAVAKRYRSLPEELRADRSLAFVYLQSIARGEHLAEVAQQVKAGQKELAFTLYDLLPQSVEKSPQGVDRFLSSIEQLRLSSFESSIERLHDSAAHPEQIDFLALRGWTELRRSDKLLATLDRLNRYFGGHPQLLTMQGRVLLESADTSLARTKPIAALKIDPGWLPAYWVLLECSLKDGNHREAVHWMNEMLKRSPGSLRNVEALPMFDRFRTSEEYRQWKSAS